MDVQGIKYDPRPWIGDRWRGLFSWSGRRWGAALAAAAAYVLALGIPTDLVPNPVFGRQIPPTWWAWPSLLVSAVLAGLLAATYVRAGEDVDNTDRQARQGLAGGLLTLFAVGCPVCNKLVLVALGSAGAITWFEPVQPFLQLAGIALLIVALHTRLAVQLSCPLPVAATASRE